MTILRDDPVCSLMLYAGMVYGIVGFASNTSFKLPVCVASVMRP